VANTNAALLASAHKLSDDAAGPTTPERQIIGSSYNHTHTCDFTQMFAVRGSKRLPQGHEKPPFLISQNFSQSEVGSIPLPKVQFGSNGLPKVRV
jgi:hypothetical protein